MGYPSFNTGDVLAAADMNAVGLWLVKTQTVGSGVSSVSVTNCFSATYDDYLIQWNGGSGSGQNIRLTFGSTATGYNSNLIYAAFGGTSVGIVGQNNAAYFDWAAHASSNRVLCEITVKGPYLSKWTNVKSIFDNETDAGQMLGVLKNTTSYTGFTLTPASGTLTGGTIRVYGYRN